jgi:ABC-type antimicrobial peptide transport system permease subunit
MTIYHSFDQQEVWGGRLFVHAHVDPHPLISPITQVIRNLSPEQPVEHAATLEDIRAEVLTPNRLNTLVFGVFACVALAIAVVGVAGVLAFSVSGRTREFGIRLAVGSQPRHLLASVIGQGTAMALGGVIAGAVGGFALVRLAASYLSNLQMPGVLPVAGAVLVLLAAAIIASVVPAARAARVDVMQALRTE